MNAGIRTIAGTRFLIDDIAALEQVSTAIVARPIDMPVNADDVVPRVGHIPNNNTNVGLRLIIPSSSTLLAVMAVIFICLSGSVYSVGKALEVIVAPVMASTSPPSALTAIVAVVPITLSF